jgi:MFS family permease
MFTSFKFFNYRLVFTYSTLMSMAGWAHQVSLDWLVLSLTGSAAALGGMVGAQLAPYIILSLVGGAVADRFNKRNFIMLVCGLNSAVAFMLFVLFHKNILTYSFLLLISLAISTINAMEAPVRNALSIEVVRKENLANAMGLNSVTFNLGRLLGTLAAGFLIAHVDNGAPWLMLGFVYSALGLSLLKLRIHEIENESFGSSKPGKLMDAVRYLRTKPALLLSMTLTSIIWGSGMHFGLTSSLMVRTVFDLDATYLGYIGTTVSLGCIVGAAIAARWAVPGHMPQFSTMLKSGICVALFWILSGMMNSFWWYAVIAGVASIFHLTFMVTSNSLVISNAPADFRGRVYGIYLFIFWIGASLGNPLIGKVAQVFSVRTAIVAGGVSTLIICTFLYFRELKKEKTRN